MNPRTSLALLTVMSPAGWFLASVLGVLACMLAPDVSGHRIPWMILGALVVGSMLSVVPVTVALVAAYSAAQPSGLSTSMPRFEELSWRWIALALLGGLEALVLPLTFVAASAEDDTLILTIPFNIAIVTAIVLLACWPFQRRAAIAICIIHMLGIVVATFAAAVEIESVVVSGMLLLVSGLALSLVGTRPRTSHVVFGLSTVFFILFSFLVIAMGKISQSAAEAPLFSAIVAYQILFVPLGMLTLYREMSERNLPFRTQFGLKQILCVMAIVCVASALAKLAFTVDDEVRVGVSLVVGLLVFTGVLAAIAAGWWAKSSDDPAQVRRASVM